MGDTYNSDGVGHIYNIMRKTIIFGLVFLLLISSVFAEEVIYQYVCKDTPLETTQIEDTTEMLLENKILLIKEAKGLELQTENYADEFRLSAYYGDVITKIIRVKNVGEEELNLIISCDGEFCNNVVLNRNSLNLPVGFDDQFTMTFTIPETYEEQKIFYSVVVQDVDDETYQASLPVFIDIDAFIGRLARIMSGETMFGEGWEITDGVTIPNFVLLVISILGTFILLNIAYNISGKNLIFGISRYVGTLAVMIIFLVFI